MLIYNDVIIIQITSNFNFFGAHDVSLMLSQGWLSSAHNIDLYYIMNKKMLSIANDIVTVDS